MPCTLIICRLARQSMQPILMPMIDKMNAKDDRVLHSGIENIHIGRTAVLTSKIRLASNLLIEHYIGK